MDRQPWLKSRVRLKHMDGGIWQVTCLDTKGWVQCEPRDDTARTLAGISPDGVVWFQKRDLIKEPENPTQGTLL